MRPLGLPSLEDKIVQKAIAQLLEAIYEADFLNCSYGFRPKRSCHQALKVVDKALMVNRVSHVIEADIKGFFDNVSHEWMMKFLEVRIKDPSLLLLISRFLKAGYLEEGYLVLAEEGTPQGGNLSPMLSNIFLHYVLDLWFEAVVKTYVKGECYMVRYADDFICMVQYDNEAKRIEQALHNRFAKFGLELHPEKTRTISFGRFEKERAQKQQRRCNTFDFLGFTHYCGKSRKNTFIVGRKTSSKKFRQKLADMNKWLKDIRDVKKCKLWWPTLIAKLRGHYQYYGVSGNSRSINLFYYRVVRAAFKWLNRCSQKTRFNWKGFREYLKHYPLPKPRIMISFYKTSNVT
jgi:group II intron reverse transcriptase/maturase